MITADNGDFQGYDYDDYNDHDDFSDGCWWWWLQWGLSEQNLWNDNDSSEKCLFIRIVIHFL